MRSFCVSPVAYAGTDMTSQAKLLTVEFLKWVALRPRSYAEARNAWSSTCPLNCAWEDAISDDLVQRGGDGGLQLTGAGRRLLGEHGGVS